ncbi:hypothetical protein [Microbacterium sp. KHB019]|uniref:hypothetical protein n=1 Tax=Microbacterium sp. KHB019 TaxID=3129770 RepID=UPI003078CAA7
MTLLPAIPACAVTPVATLLGSAFLAEVEGRAFLLTAAHVPLGEHPTDDWHRYATHLMLIVGAGRVGLDLFTGDENREKRFSLRRRRATRSNWRRSSPTTS